MDTLDKLYSKIDEQEGINTLAEKQPFDSECWVKWLGNYQRDVNVRSVRALRRVIIKQTIDCCKKRRYKYNNQFIELCTAQQVKAQAINTIFYDFTDQYDLKVDKEKVYKTKVTVLNGDCLEAAIHLKQKNLNPVVLNMASAKRAGGGYRSGAGAQEENLFRRTNYFQILEDPEKLDSKRNWSYPINEFTGIYSPSVLVFRDTEQKGYAYLPDPIDMSFLAFPAYRRPALVNGKLADKFAENTKQKMRTIFHIALLNNHDSIVLSAMGCGAFRNPPLHIAQLFKEVMEEVNILGKFKHIVFAIFDDSNTGKAHNPEGNFAPFASVFSTVSPDFQIVDIIIPKNSIVLPQIQNNLIMAPDVPIINLEEQHHHYQPKSSRIIKKVKKIIEKMPDSTEEIIYFGSPQESYGCFSPLFKSPFKSDGKTWHSVEHYISYQKFQNTEWESKIISTNQPLKVRNLCKSIPDDFISENWKNQKENIMFEANIQKFGQNENLKIILLDTGKKEIIFFEDDDWWGSGLDQKGKNVLGTILVQVRQKLSIY